MRHLLTALAAIATAVSPAAQTPAPTPTVTILRPARVFDGETVHEGWAVRVKGERIDAVGPAASVAAAGATTIDLPRTTLLPGLVEGHSHILLHAYSETSWTDQVSREGLALRVARATNHLHATLMAGFTTVRDLGTEGAQYADVELRDAVRQGIINRFANVCHDPSRRGRLKRSVMEPGSRWTLPEPDLILIEPDLI